MIDKILSEKNVRIELITLQDKEGQDSFAYILISESDYENFLKAKETGQIDPDEHGMVIAYGLGKEPPEEIKKTIRQLLQ